MGITENILPAKINRRCALRAVMGAAASLAVPCTVQAGQNASLATLAAARGMRFGSAMSLKGLAQPGYLDLINRECAIIVCENEMKWLFLRPTAKAFDFAKADQIVSFANSTGKRLRGHTLLFHQGLNAAWDDLCARNGAEPTLTGHIAATIAHYKHTVHSWDVVNEPIDPKSSRPDRLRNSPFLESMGEKYRRYCVSRSSRCRSQCHSRAQ